jgi:hypothetical protein
LRLSPCITSFLAGFQSFRFRWTHYCRGSAVVIAPDTSALGRCQGFCYFEVKTAFYFLGACDPQKIKEKETSYKQEIRYSSAGLSQLDVSEQPQSLFCGEAAANCAAVTTPRNFIDFYVKIN